jgi:hypothetical protein
MASQRISNQIPLLGRNALIGHGTAQRGYLAVGFTDKLRVQLGITQRTWSAAAEFLE